MRKILVITPEVSEAEIEKVMAAYTEALEQHEQKVIDSFKAACEIKFNEQRAMEPPLF